MCNPTIAVTAIAGASSYINYRQQLQAQKNAEQAQIRQNELAKKNALQRYASEQLRIRQVVKQSQEKGFQATKKRRQQTEKFMAFRADRGVAMSGSMNALLADYYRTEGNFNSARHCLHTSTNFSGSSVHCTFIETRSEFYVY